MDRLSVLVRFRGLNRNGRIAERTFDFRVSLFHKTPPELAEEGMKFNRFSEQNTQRGHFSSSENFAIMHLQTH